MDFKFSKILLMSLWYLLIANTTTAYTRQDTLRGSNGSGRNWWDVQSYALAVYIDTANKTISGSVEMSFAVTGHGSKMQIDLQDTLVLDSVFLVSQYYGKIPQLKDSAWLCKYIPLSYQREGNVYWIANKQTDLKVDSTYTIAMYYHGKPRIAKLPPWDGGFIWAKDSTGKPWIAVACQGLGASAWWPCKDYQGDEPDKGMVFDLSISGEPDVISNGRKVESSINVSTDDSVIKSIGWSVKNPINTYDASFYIGDYISWKDTLIGENGKLDLSYYALRYNEVKARKQFAVTKQMLHCFEYWMGPYPFYEDGYKLVEAPYLGMEHQSAVAYGNEYKMGYRGQDRSGTGVGLLFDFIIVHESGHEWFGNNITAQDIADNWLHEGFTTYTEALFAECTAGRDKAFEYTRGEWRNIRNDRPVIGDYGVNDDGSSDKYDKGSAVVHMIRVIMNDDEKFRQLLRGLNKDFYHKIVTSKQVEDYIQKFTGLDLAAFFNQYLRTTHIPQFDWYISKKRLYYRFNNVEQGFSLPIDIMSSKKTAHISPTGKWQSISWRKGGYNISVSPDFLITVK